jgi:hypothetical protein
LQSGQFSSLQSRDASFSRGSGVCATTIEAVKRELLASRRERRVRELLVEPAHSSARRDAAGFDGAPRLGRKLGVLGHGSVPRTQIDERAR